MAGSIALSLTQRYDKTSHEPLDGGQLYFFAAGTTTPQSAYQDISLAIPWPNPITLDSGGNVPQLFFADGYVKFRLSNAAGVTQIEADFVLVLGPTAGAGAAPSVDATTIMQVGYLAMYYGTGVRTGFVRANGRTIGSASSGASEYANAAAQTLFEYLWTEDANLTVSTGRGASAAADWAANKNIALPDWRGRALAALDDMGNTAAGRLTSTYFGTAATVLGAASSSESNNVILTHTHIADAVANHQHLTVYDDTSGVSLTASNYLVRFQTGAGDLSYSLAGSASTANVGLTSSAGGHTPTIQNAGSASAHNIVQPTMLATVYIKL
jgi:hypothetical protein